MPSLLEIDELNVLKRLLDMTAKSEADDDEDYDDYIVDTITGILILAYRKGIESAGEQLNKNLVPDNLKLRDALEKVIAGKTYVDRLNEYLVTDDYSSIYRVAETESHRMINQGILDGGISAGAATKTWHTMLDDRVRDTHDYLEGETVPIDQDFYTYTGDHAPAPGQFGVPGQDVNCRCYISLSY